MKDNAEADFDPFNIDEALGPIMAVTGAETVDRDKSIPDVISEEDAVAELIGEIDDALDYMSEFHEKWEEAQKYFDGGVDLPTVEGRSKAVATAVANAVRGVMPSMMRTLCSTGAIVEYLPHTRLSASIAAAQTLYVNQLFQRAGGYTILSNIGTNACLKGMGPVKWYFKKRGVPKYITMTGVLQPQYERLVNDPNIKVLSVEPRTIQLDPDMGGQADPAAAPQGAIEIPVYDCEIGYIEVDGEIVVESIPLPDFFISRNATDCDDARVVGHRRNMRVGDLMQLGIPYEKLEDLDDYDPEVSDGGQAEATKRRKAAKDNEAQSADPMMKQVMVTEVYASFDIDGMGVPQIWRFLLGGTNRELLLRERASRVQMCIGRIDFIPHAAIGGSIHDRAKQDQDTITSVLRGTLDNLHMSNNRRLAIHENLVNIADVMSPKIGAPIRVRQSGQIQEIGVQAQIGASLPLLQYLGAEAQTRVGVTAAAMGLDPDALQSTDKDAVRNTIQLSQGQIELFVRNLAQSLMPLFKGLLELSMWHKSRYQNVLVGEQAIPIDQMQFDPTYWMQPKVGLGTNDVEIQRANLTMIYQEQKQTMQVMGPSNPFCNMSHLSNTLEDLMRLSNINNPDRYFTAITPEQGKQMAEQAAQAAADAAEKAAQIPDPVSAMLQAEAMKSAAAENQTKLKEVSQQRMKALDLQFNALMANAKDDLERDKLAQQKWLETAKIIGQYMVQPQVDAINAEQEAPRKSVA